MKVVVLLCIVAIAVVDCAPVMKTTKKNSVQMPQRNSRSYVKSTICDDQFVSRKQGNESKDKYNAITENPTLNSDYVLCRIDAEFGQGTSRNLVVVSIVMLLLIVIGFVRNICCTE